MTQSDRLSRDSTKSTSGPHTNEEELLLREGSSSSSQGGLPSLDEDDEIKELSPTTTISAPPSAKDSHAAGLGGTLS